jgi:cation:H+ antiporter
VILYDLLVLGLSLSALLLSGRWLISPLLTLTRLFRLPEFSVGFIVLAIATSLPEIFVGLASARAGAADLVLSTALGSNIVNMTLIVGLATVASLGIKTSGLRPRRDLFLGGLITLLPLLLLYDHSLSRFDGLLLTLAFCFYIWRLAKDRSQPTASSPLPAPPLLASLKTFLLTIILLTILLFSADSTVQAATSLATSINLPPFLIGLFVLAFGTSLPELVTTLNAALQRRPGLALGTILGSNVADSGLVVGLAALTQPLITPLTPNLLITGGFVFLSLLIISYFALTHRRLSVNEGFGLILLFFLFGFFLFILNTPFLITA